MAALDFSQTCLKEVHKQFLNASKKKERMYMSDFDHHGLNSGLNMWFYNALTLHITVKLCKTAIMCIIFRNINNTRKMLTSTQFLDPANRATQQEGFVIEQLKRRVKSAAYAGIHNRNSILHLPSRPFSSHTYLTHPGTYPNFSVNPTKTPLPSYMQF